MENLNKEFLDLGMCYEKNITVSRIL